MDRFLRHKPTGVVYIRQPVFLDDPNFEECGDAKGTPLTVKQRRKLDAVDSAVKAAAESAALAAARAAGVLLDFEQNPNAPIRLAEDDEPPSTGGFSAPQVGLALPVDLAQAGDDAVAQAIADAAAALSADASRKIA
jgi:hypothetical protein